MEMEPMAERSELVQQRRVEDPYRPLRTGRRVLVAILAVFCVFYFPVLHLAAASAIPLVALFVVGAGLGLVGRRKAPILCAVAGWLVVAATAVRRIATARYAPQLFLFDGALAGYPTWSVWFAEVLRVGGYLWGLWVGAKAGRRLRFAVDAGLRHLISRLA